MIESKQKVADICKEVYVQYEQLTIDIAQEVQEDLINNQEEITPDDVGAWSYAVGTFLDIFNPFYEQDIELLTRLEDALDEWQRDLIKANILLGLSKN